MAELSKVDLERLSGERGSLGRLIEESRACGECGYDLKGLRIGGTCPECGTPITWSRHKREPDMGESPKGYLLQMSIGMTLVGLGGFGWVVLFFLGPLLRVFGGIRVPFPPITVIALGLAWSGGTLLILRERPFAKKRREEKGERPEWWAVRLTIAATQVFGLVVAASFLLFHATSWPGWAVFMLLSLVVMFVGWAPLCLYLSRIAYWAGDDDMGARFHAMSYWLAALGIGTAFLFGPDVGVLIALRWVGVVALGFFLIVSVIVMLAIMRMSSTIRWAEQNAANARARDRRLAAKAKAEMERARAEREAQVAAGGGTAMTSDQEALLAEIERKHREMAAREEADEGVEGADPEPGRQHIVESGDSVETFGLEEDEGPGSARRGTA